MSVVLVVLAAAAPVAAVPSEKRFGSWRVACDNVRTCGGVSLSGHDLSGDDTPWIVHFVRRAGPAAAVTVEGNPVFQEIEPGAVSLRIDGKPSAFGFDGNGKAVGDTARLLGALAAARQVDVIDARGKRVGFVPVAGSSAALRFVDDRQGRTGTLTALVAAGPKPAAAVPRPPALVRIAQPPASAAPPRKLGKADIANIQRLSEFCNSDDKGPDRTTSYWRLDARTTLAIVPCSLGAYQSNALVVTLNEEGRWTPARIEQYYRSPEPALTPADDFTLTEADYDRAKRLLLSVAKGRGLNDCGMGASWAWDGKMFRLASYQALDACGGAPPGTWLPRWQTANDPLVDR